MKFNFDLCTGHHLTSGRAVGEELGPSINSGCSDAHRFCTHLFYLCFVVFGICGKCPCQQCKQYQQCKPCQQCKQNVISPPQAQTRERLHPNVSSPQSVKKDPSLNSNIEKFPSKLILLSSPHMRGDLKCTQSLLLCFYKM